MTKRNRFAAQSRSMVPIVVGTAPVYKYRPIDCKDIFDVNLTSDPNSVVITTKSEKLFDHLRNHYDVLWITRSHYNARAKYYSVGLSLCTYTHFVSWNSSAFSYADGSKDCCFFFPRY